MHYFNIWEFIAGLGIFLFGMLQMEDAIKTIAGRSFKLFLMKHSHSKVKGILSGAAVTAVLQSSSVVSLIVLAFVGAGVIPLKSAIAVIFGANLGTTVTGWLVAMVGFKVDIELLAFPLIGVGGLIMIMLESRRYWKHLGQALLGLGFLFLGLEFMKTSVTQLAENFDLTPYVHHSLFVFLVVGVVLTAIIQSSSASMVITLSALYSNIIPLESAAAIVIGSNLGTTTTVLVGGLPGLPAKKRVATAHFIFNLVTGILAFIALDWLLTMIGLTGVADPLVALVLLHSSFNAFGLVLFYPFINLLANFLENRFRDEDVHEAKFIYKLTTEVPEAALQALDQEVDHLYQKVLTMLKTNFDLNPNDTFKLDFKRDAATRTFKQQYQSIKQLEGEMFQFYTGLQQRELEPADSKRLSQLIGSIRYLLHAAKSAKDVHKNLFELRDSTHRSLNQLFEIIRDREVPFLSDLDKLLHEGTTATLPEELTEMLQHNQVIYEELLKSIYQDLSRKKLTQIEISTILNVNRELYSSRKALVQALNEYLSSVQEIVDFHNPPVTVRG